MSDDGTPKSKPHPIRGPATKELEFLIEEETQDSPKYAATSGAPVPGAISDHPMPNDELQLRKITPRRLCRDHRPENLNLFKFRRFSSTIDETLSPMTQLANSLSGAKIVAKDDDQLDSVEPSGFDNDDRGKDMHNDLHNSDSTASSSGAICDLDSGFEFPTIYEQSGSDNDSQQQRFATVDNSLISNSFTLNSGGRSPSARRAESRARGVQRRVNMAPLRINYDSSSNNSMSPGKINDAVMSSMSTEDLSFYAGTSPQASPRPCSASPELGLLSPETSPLRFTVVQADDQMHQFSRTQSEDGMNDGNSMDSGYSASFVQHGGGAQKRNFKFVAPNGVPPRRIDPSPRKSSFTSTSSSSATSSAATSPKSSNFRIFNSLSSGSMESIMDDDYLELFEMEALDENAQLPCDLGKLISGNIMSTRTTPENKRPLVRRCLSLNENESNRARTNLFTTAENYRALPKTPESSSILQPVSENITPYISRSFKRPEPPTENPIQSKRVRGDPSDEKENQHIMLTSSSATSDLIRRPALRKSISMNDTSLIMNALAKSSESEANLIGDFTKPYCLPLVSGARNSDLKSISAVTMAKLLNGDFLDRVASYKIVDCRYPYEFEGGHIRDAKNLYTQEQIVEELVTVKPELVESGAEEGCEILGQKRDILVFHCEFSSERGPKLSRFLRNLDRSRNENVYPTLRYPEIYLLSGGYKDFFEVHPELCEPNAYRPMLHPSYVDSYRHFRTKSKSWNGDVKASGNLNRLTKSRSRLVL